MESLYLLWIETGSQRNDMVTLKGSENKINTFLYKIFIVKHSKDLNIIYTIKPKRNSMYAYININTCHIISKLLIFLSHFLLKSYHSHGSNPHWWSIQMGQCVLSDPFSDLCLIHTYRTQVLWPRMGIE